MTTSEPRRLRSRKLRSLLWLAADGRCRLCGRPLPDDWHADHVTPWSECRRTNPFEMQALCPECNLAKGTSYMDLSKAREGQQGALDVALSRLRAGEHQTAIVLPTGYGKSDLIRMIAFRAWDWGLASCTLVLSPNDYLRGQMVEEDRFAAFMSRYTPRPSSRKPIKYGFVTAVRDTNLTPNGEFLLSANMQLANNNRHLLGCWIESMQHATGKPVILLVDETHTNSDGNRWGETVCALRDAGAHLIVMTATAFRADDDPLIGFDLEEKETEEITVVKTRPGKTPETVLVQLWGGTKTRWELRPHFKVDFKQAWNEGVICHINHHPFDLDLTSLTDEHAETKLLSALSETETRRVLGRLVRWPEVMQAGCGQLAHWLGRVRGAGGVFSHDVAGIVFCGNDRPDDDQANDHAERIRNIILKINPRLSVVIATSANDPSGRGKSGVGVLNAFVDDGVGDVLVVKQMASAGLDCPRLKVALDLSPVRTPVSFIQRSMRIGRPYNGITVAHLITPADVLSRACFDKFIDAEGGATTKDIELEEEYEAPRSGAAATVYQLGGIAGADVRDTKDRTALREQLPAIIAVIEAFPLLLNGYTLPDIAARLDLFKGLAKDPEPPPDRSVNTSDQIAAAKADMLAAVKSVVKVRMARAGRRYSPDPADKQLYGETVQAVWSEARRAARLTDDFHYETCRDQAMLEALAQEVNAVLDAEIDRQ